LTSLWSVAACYTIAFWTNACTPTRKKERKKERKSLNYYDQANTFSEKKSHSSFETGSLPSVAGRSQTIRQSVSGFLKNCEEPGFPRFKAKTQYDSFTFPQGGYSINSRNSSVDVTGDLHSQIASINSNSVSDSF
jgi:putative transposase